MRLANDLSESSFSLSLLCVFPVLLFTLFLSGKRDEVLNMDAMIGEECWRNSSSLEGSEVLSSV